jgi:predicted nucleotidyltransferase
MAIRVSERRIHRWPTGRAKQWLSSFLDRARRDPNVVAVVAVGSSVRIGVASDDLDVVVLCRDPERFRERAPIEVDLRRINIDCVDESIRAGRDLVIWAVRFGRSLFDRENIWADIVRNWKNRLPVPDSGVSLQRARTTFQRMEEMRAIGDENAFDELQVSYLTHRAWARLTSVGVYPASRPELPGQLRSIGEGSLADDLDVALSERARTTG